MERIKNDEESACTDDVMVDFTQFAFRAADAPSELEFPETSSSDRMALHFRNAETLAWCRADYSGIRIGSGVWRCITKNKPAIVDFLSKCPCKLIVWDREDFLTFDPGVARCVTPLQTSVRLYAGVWTSKKNGGATIGDVEAQVCAIPATEDEHRLVNIYCEGEFRGWW